MNTTLQSRSLPRLLLGVAVALLLGLALAQGAGAEPKTPVKGTIAQRTQGQKDLCDVSGGTFEVETTYSSVFRGQVTKTVTTCSGGQYPQTCTNTSKNTTCTPAFTPPPQDPVDDGSIGDGQIDEVQTAPEPEVTVDDGSIGDGQIEPISTGDIGPAEPHRIEIEVEFTPIEPLP